MHLSLMTMMRTSDDLNQLFWVILQNTINIKFFLVIIKSKNERMKE